MGNSVKSEIKATEPRDNEQEDERRPEDHQLKKKVKQVKEKLIRANKGNTKKDENELQTLQRSWLTRIRSRQSFLHIFWSTRKMLGR
jgi:hypothetical protein